jgi:glutathione synthase/RimK-type ligase-like ATP-grasp enzyme
MRRCAFLTLADPTGYVIDDQLALEPLFELGWQCDSVPWTNDAVEWTAYDAIVIRSTWDYATQPERFLATLRSIESSGVPLFNSADLVEWNLEKSYLRQLADRGVPIVPTVWCDNIRRGELRQSLESFGEVVVKPLVGAGAIGAFRVSPAASAEEVAGVETEYADRNAMIQPFLTNITGEGEFSLFYFNGRYSHAILKTPQPRDFRVQEEHGGIIRAVSPDSLLHAAGEAVMQSIGDPPLYARADFVRSNDGSQFWLIELELIEPSLYLRMDGAAPRRLAEAIVERAT